MVTGVDDTTGDESAGGGEGGALGLSSRPAPHCSQNFMSPVT